MQTFLPYADFTLSLLILDKRRLGKQRVEAYQILKAIHNPCYGWQNHPAVKMWRGYETALTDYYNKTLIAFADSGGKNIKLQPITLSGKIEKPRWLGDPAFHASHRSNLLRKDAVFYGQYGWLEPNNLPYVWPVS